VNIKVISAGISALSLSAGAVAGYFFAKRQLEAKYSRLLEAEIAATKAHYSMLHKREEFSTPEEAAATLKRDLVQANRPVRPPVRVMEELVDGLKYRIPHNNDDDPVEKRDPSAPYIISVDEYMGNEHEWTQCTLTFYAGDDVLVDEGEMPMGDVDNIVGEANLEQFGRKSKDARVVYVRTPRLEIEYEVVRNEGSFTEIVHGLDQPKKRKVHKFKE